MRILFIVLLLSLSLFSRQCADQYDPEGFLDAPERLGEIIDENLQGLKLFGDAKEYAKKLHYKKMKMWEDEYFVKPNSFIKEGDHYYPTVSGLWRYHVGENGMVDEVDITDAYEYKDAIESVANEINSDFEGLWRGWGGDSYSFHLKPEDAQLRYFSYYLNLNVYLFGVKEDASTLKKTVVDYRILNYTDEVNNYIKCKEEK